ncbi:MAG: pilus assembly protein PilX [Thauera sp.]|nr:pilus assembly protein PilX [Thauera sp.]
MEPLTCRRRRQRGTALFVALIMLVAMSIAAVSLVRSVDTTVVITGNLAFQQTALQVADYGIEAAAGDLVTIRANSRDARWRRGDTCAIPGGSRTAFNYYPTLFERASTGSPTIDGVTYTGGYPGVPSLDWNTVPCVTNTRIPAGYAVQYLIDRLCNHATNCVADNPQEGGSRRAGQARFSGAPSIHYRVTVRVSGPNNAQSFVQVTMRD